MHSIIPGILEKTPQEIAKKLEILKPFSRSVHIDFIDGKFAPEVSFFDENFFKNYKDDFFLEAHLMTMSPHILVKNLANAGFKRFIGHIEKMDNIEEFVALGQIYGEVGIAIDIDTKLESINIPYNDLDSILVMTVKAGKSGQEFMPQVLEKIQKIREVSQIPIEVDGGINDKTILIAKEKGATRFVATSFIFNSKDPIKSYETLSSLC